MYDIFCKFSGLCKIYDFCIGNVFKYIWRAGLKSEEGICSEEKEIEDLIKAKEYIEKEIEFKTDLLKKKYSNNI